MICLDHPNLFEVPCFAAARPRSLQAIYIAISPGRLTTIRRLCRSLPTDTWGQKFIDGREVPVLSMAITKEHVHPSPAFIIMPVIVRVVNSTIGVPWPISTNDFCRGTSRDFRCFDGG